MSGVVEALTRLAAVPAVLVVGVHGRHRLSFPGEWFPGLIRQARNAVQVWRPRGGPQR